MRLSPKSDRILAKKISIEERVQSGIILISGKEAVEGALEFLLAEVVEVGPGKIIDSSGAYVPMEVKKGEIILYNPRQAISFYFNGEEYLTLRASECPYEVVDLEGVKFKYEKENSLENIAMKIPVQHSQI